MAEHVRLVVWDLDETFWKGTVSEGGIQEYVQAHHDIVIELARRGIMSSICSKNDEAAVRPILREKGILEYFVFPSISWEPKGMRLARLVATVQLRAPTIMFIDDNPSNRAEAAANVPGLQVEDQTFIPNMLSDPRFRGQDDAQLTRLAQYKLLEQRKRDEEHAAGDNADFLRSCDVRVCIDYDIDAHIDRAIELINRTNQLNYTKQRLSEDAATARQQLRDQMRPFGQSVGLVRVADKYGDYGFVGFFMTVVMRRTIEDGAANAHLAHFCFSCRTLGMLIEQWVYDYLGRPELDVVGEVLTDLSVPRKIDWIRLVAALDGDATPQHTKIAPQIVLYGGCEAQAIGLYLNSYTDRLDVYGNYVSNGIFVSINYAARFLDICDRNPRQIAAEADALGLPLHLETGDLFSESEPGTLFVVKLSLDAQGSARLHHKVHDWSFVLSPNGLGPDVIYDTPEPELAELLDPAKTSFTAAQRDHMLRVSRHLREHYEKVEKPQDQELVEDMREMISRVPGGSKFIIIADHDEIRPSYPLEEVTRLPWFTSYSLLMKGLADEYSYTAFVSFSDVLKSTEELAGGNHYDREVYLRLAQRIVDVASALEPRSDTPVPKRRLARLVATQRVKKRWEAEARDLVQAGYECLLRRQPDPVSGEFFVTALAEGRISSAEFIRIITRTDEFKDRWTVPEHVAAS